VIQPVRHAPARTTALQYRAMPAALLFDAITAGDLDGVKALLTADPALVDAKTDAGVSAILTAVYHGRRDIANLRVARGATRPVRGPGRRRSGAGGAVARRGCGGHRQYGADNWMALHLAAFFGHHRSPSCSWARGRSACGVAQREREHAAACGAGGRSRDDSRLRFAAT
jgi:hypothetical protein